MGSRTIGFGNILEEESIEEEEWTPTSATVITCPACKTSFYYQDYNEDNAADGCLCENRNLTIGLISYEDSGYKFYLAVRYKTDYPVFSEIPYDEYLKLKNP